MNIGQLRKVLMTAGDQYRNDNRGDIADALSAIATNLLRGSDRTSVATFVRNVEKARKPAVKRTTRKPQRKR